MAASASASSAFLLDEQREAVREKAFAAERASAGIRVLVILFNSLVYQYLLPKNGPTTVLAYAIIVLANAYGIGYYLTQPYRRFSVMTSSWFSSSFDALFIAVWLYATGGIASPYFPLWYVSVTAIAFRFGARETFFAAVLYAASYAVLAVASGQLAGNESVLLVRCAYIGFVAAIGGLLAQEGQAQMREKVAARATAQALRESEERVRRLNDAAFEGILIHDAGLILDANEAFARMLRVERESLLGRSVLDLVVPDDVEKVRERVAERYSQAYEVTGKRTDGTTFPAEVVGRDFPWQGRVVRVTAIRDVTERKRAESALVEQERLRAKNDRLEEIDRLKTQFINSAAHELATPLTPIKIQSHMLRVGSLGPLNERQRKAVSVVARNVDHLGLLMRDVIDSARVQGGDLVLHPGMMDFALVAREAVESFEESAQRAGITLRVDAPTTLPLVADRERITQVLFNLCSNALKFTPSGGTIDVSVRASGGPDVIVEVRDSGAGIRAEDMPRLFRPFSQAHDPMQSTHAGTGLGLFLSKGIVEAHGGRIWATSEGEGEGANFTFTVPGGAGR